LLLGWEVGLCLSKSELRFELINLRELLHDILLFLESSSLVESDLILGPTSLA
jgi:hypothetical protein